MPGKKNRPYRMGEPSRSWNILFPTKDIAAAGKLGEDLGITPAAVARAALREFLTGEKAPAPSRGGSFEEGVDAAVEALRMEVKSPVFPSGQTLGDRLAEKVRSKMKRGKVD
jgi:hypothetical protein